MLVSPRIQHLLFTGRGTKRIDPKRTGPERIALMMTTQMPCSPARHPRSRFSHQIRSRVDSTKSIEPMLKTNDSVYSRGGGRSTAAGDVLHRSARHTDTEYPVRAYHHGPRMRSKMNKKKIMNQKADQLSLDDVVHESHDIPKDGR